MERHEATAITLMLTSGYPAWKPTKHTLELYETFLRPVPAAFVNQAVMEIVGNYDREFAPPISLIRRRAAEIEYERAGLPMLTASEAWEQVERRISIHDGHDDAPHVDHDVINRAINAVGGWQQIRNATEPAVMRAQFRRAYEEFRETILREAVETIASGKRLPGPDERQKMLADQRDADNQERKKLDFDQRVGQTQRAYGISSRDEAIEFMASGLSYREFFNGNSSHAKRLPAPSEEAVN